VLEWLKYPESLISCMSAKSDERLHIVQSEAEKPHLFLHRLHELCFALLTLEAVS
jgi:hypothetical protein